MVNIMESNFYSVLGVEHTASIEEIKKAYRRQLRLTHPDTGDVPDAKAFHQVQEAWDTLGDQAKRAVYDQGLLGLTSIFDDKDFYESHFNFKVPDASSFETPEAAYRRETLNASARKVQKETEEKLAAEQERLRQMNALGRPSFPMNLTRFGNTVASFYVSAIAWDVPYDKVSHWRRNDNRIVRSLLILMILVNLETFVLNVLMSKVDKSTAVLHWVAASFGIDIATIAGLFVIGVGLWAYRWARYSIIAHMPKSDPPRVF